MKRTATHTVAAQIPAKRLLRATGAFRLFDVVANFALGAAVAGAKQMTKTELAPERLAHSQSLKTS